MKKQKPLITVADLKRELAVYPDHFEIDFSGLDFYRLKQRGDALVQIEFNQPVYRDRQGDVVVENLE